MVVGFRGQALPPVPVRARTSTSASPCSACLPPRHAPPSPGEVPAGVGRLRLYPVCSAAGLAPAPAVPAETATNVRGRESESEHRASATWLSTPGGVTVCNSVALIHPRALTRSAAAAGSRASRAATTRSARSSVQTGIRSAQQEGRHFSRALVCTHTTFTKKRQVHFQPLV